MSNINLKDYIKNIYYLEKSLYEQRNLDKSLIAEIKRYSNDENILRAVNTNKDFLNLKKHLSMFSFNQTLKKRLPIKG